ncbi:hypothetical protein BB560_002176 [Smittium megazygosporum]|uniref:Glutamine-dependent NAD(+) synthetase n=1 Tax=Smittium megazygosporum TaxID=133381 RepID=A0A2T9ZFK0_9FUNG|nr:hypothetical protein BB560_002176 [Smittium megazygosporum]
MDSLVTIATCSLNQWALDFTGNYQRIKASILQAKAQNAKIRLGSELEIPGYSCQDHFFEHDTVYHSWQVLAKLLSDPELFGILVVTGMPVLFKGHRYNCSVLFLDGKVLLIRPKLWLASDGNYREYRYFTKFELTSLTVNFLLPTNIQAINGQKSTSFGHALLESSNGVVIGVEMCEELFVPYSPHIQMSLDGCDIILNSSASHHELRKLYKRVSLIKSATSKCGGVYVYSNLHGCDGDRLYFDGSSMIACNGALFAISPQFSLEDVITISATIDINSIRSYRSSIPSIGSQSSIVKSLTRIPTDFCFDSQNPPSYPIRETYLSPEQEISLGPACWLWDYLRRSKQGGFFLPISGGIDSCSVALIVYSMCVQVEKALLAKNKAVLDDVNEILDTNYSFSGESCTPITAKDLCNKLLYTCYMGTENSSNETKTRAASLSSDINSYHSSIVFDAVIAAVLMVFSMLTGKSPKYGVDGGSRQENLALQNIQARLRMVLSYLFASLLPWTRYVSDKKKRYRSLLVLGSSNADEALRGYFTKYDCSSADLNPIGSISKTDLRSFVGFSQQEFQFNILSQFLDAVPSAELIPTRTNSETKGIAVQSDEQEMGLTYEQLEVFGKYRKSSKFYSGPLSMYNKLVIRWSHLPKQEVARLVKHFFFYYAINRHKMTTLTPSYHAESYSPDDNRFDHRPFLYNADYSWQFEEIDKLVASNE